MTYETFNPAQITRAGFEYQDLLGIGFLLEAYQDPDLYEWIALDSDAPVSGQSLGGLDDIVAMRRADRTLVLRQVKFTVDPGRADLELSTDWLVERRPRGKSKIGKWSERLLAARRAGLRVDAALLTNRIPDGHLAAALERGHLDPDRLPSSNRASLVAEVGSEEDARAFFAAFRFEHSQPRMTGLEKALRDRVVPDHTDDDGWRRLREAVRYWSISTDRPRAGGRILHEDLRDLLSTRRPRPLSQDFRIPDGYVPPDADFDRRFQANLEPPGVVVLTGPPGRGKSTYLSHVAREISATRPVVRHHYFLSLARNEERSRYVDAAYSLVHQLALLLPEVEVRLGVDADKLPEWLTAVGEHLLNSGQTLLVAIDGLDHVWRDTGDAGQLNRLFNALLPPPPGVTVVVGTQPVPDAHLPRRLVANVRREDWHYLPGMSADAIRVWVERQADVGRLELPKNWDPPDALTDIARAFAEVTGGHPLHLVYSFEALLSRPGPVLPWTVRELPRCPEGDIRRYYDGLWAALSSEARELAHLMAIAEFPWPPNGAIECLGGSAAIGAWTEVAHLTVTRRTGTLPFHESLVAWMRDRPDHKEAEGRLVPRVVSWLREREPNDAWRWGWLWIMQARAGEPDDLVSGPSRPWLLDALCRGRPTKGIDRVIHAAERAAFSRGTYPRVVELRALRMRLVNGVKLQIDEFAPFLETALRLSGDRVGMDALIEDPRATTSPELLVASRLFCEEENDVSREMFDELNARLDHHARYGSGMERPERGLPRLVVAAAANVREFRDTAVASYVVEQEDGADLFGAFVDDLVVRRDFTRLAALAAAPDLKGSPRTLLGLALLRLGMQEEVDFRLRPELLPIFEHPLGVCWAVSKRMHPVRPPSAVPPSRPELRNRYASRRLLEDFLHFRFFEVAATALVAQEVSSLVRAGGIAERPWLSGAIAWLEERAGVVAGEIRRGAPPGIAVIARLLDELPPPPSEGHLEERQDDILFRRAVGRVGADLELLRRSLGLGETIRAAAMRDDVVLRGMVGPASEYLSERGIRLLTPELARDRVAVEAASLRKRVTQFDERALAWLGLSRFALFHGLNDDAAVFLRHAASCVVGYFYRKDLTIIEILYAIEACLDAGMLEARRWLAEMAPSVEVVTDYTDGDETDYAKRELARILADHAPDWLPGMCEESLLASEWRNLESIFAVALKAVPTGTEVGRALLSTLAFRSELKILEERAEAGDPGASTALAEQLLTTGGMPRASRRRDGYPGSTTEEQEASSPEGPWFGEYPPDRLDLFLEEIDAYPVGSGRGESALDGWILYWERMGRGPEAVRSLEAATGEGKHRWPAEKSLDLACEVSLRTLGREAAYALFVHTHVVRSGWATWLSNRHDSVRRLRRVAELFPDRWEDYVRRTATRGDGPLAGTWLVIGHELWVEFFLRVGQRDLAAAVVRAMIDAHCSEIADQPLRPVRWVPAEP